MITCSNLFSRQDIMEMLEKIKQKLDKEEKEEHKIY